MRSALLPHRRTPRASLSESRLCDLGRAPGTGVAERRCGCSTCAGDLHDQPAENTVDCHIQEQQTGRQLRMQSSLWLAVPAGLPLHPCSATTSKAAARGGTCLPAGGQQRAWLVRHCLTGLVCLCHAAAAAAAMLPACHDCRLPPCLGAPCSSCWRAMGNLLEAGQLCNIAAAGEQACMQARATSARTRPFAIARHFPHIAHTFDQPVSSSPPQPPPGHLAFVGLHDMRMERERGWMQGPAPRRMHGCHAAGWGTSTACFKAAHEREVGR